MLGRHGVATDMIPCSCKQSLVHAPVRYKDMKVEERLIREGKSADLGDSSSARLTTLCCGVCIILLSISQWFTAMIFLLGIPGISSGHSWLCFVQAGWTLFFLLRILGHGCFMWEVFLKSIGSMGMNWSTEIRSEDGLILYLHGLLSVSSPTRRRHVLVSCTPGNSKFLGS